jgi:glycosyltransferase involved in cell wall biosynthesis
MRDAVGYFISVIIPARNAEATIGACLAAAFASSYEPFEVIVVDDGSEDRSVEIIETFPCKLLRLATHSGASRARNLGAAHSRGDALFFTDADCLLQEDTLSVAGKALAAASPDTVVGGTYTRVPHDRGFFSVFQSVFVNYFETKRAERPDYVAAHAMTMGAALFRRTAGFAEDFLPILEDVEFSHRLRRAGVQLVVDPDLEVRHIFNFSLLGSLRNALRKSLYWTAYSLGRGDLFADSGTASAELKVNVGAHGVSALLLCLALVTGQRLLPWLLPGVLGVNLFLNRRFLGAFWRAGGPRFALGAAAYWVLVYPLALEAGALAGALRHLARSHRRRAD